MARNRRNGRKNGKIVNNEKIVEKSYSKIVLIIAIVIIGCVGVIALRNYQQSLEVARQREILDEQIALIFEEDENVNAEGNANEQTNEEKTNTTTETKIEDKIVNVAIVGDMLCGNGMIEDAKTADESYDFTHMFTQIDKYVKNSDLSIGTFETNLTDNEYSGTGKYNAPKEFAKAVKNSGIDVVSLAHNHVLDYGVEGLQKTKIELATIGYYTVGAKSLLGEKNYIVKEINGVKIAILAYTYGFSNESELSTEDKQYVNIYSDEVAKKDLDSALKETDCAIVIMHWGDVNSTKISTEQERIANYLIENGAKIIAGSHPAVVEPMQIKENLEGEKVFVAYSLGNYTSSLQYENSNLEIILNVKMCKDAESGKVTLKEAYYTPIYMLDNGTKAEDRYTLIDIKQKAKDYLDGVDQTIGKSIYDKLIAGLNNLEKIIKK